MLQWTCKSFEELTTDELYKIIQLRLSVFVVEQECFYQDCDDKDRHSYHLMGWSGEKLLAYARLMPPGISYEAASIGRVVTDSSIRRTGIGKELMKTAIEKVQNLFSCNTIVISAQVYLIPFYSSFGFKTKGASYPEDGIEHIKMIYP